MHLLSHRHIDPEVYQAALYIDIYSMWKVSNSCLAFWSIHYAITLKLMIQLVSHFPKLSLSLGCSWVVLVEFLCLVTYWLRELNTCVNAEFLVNGSLYMWASNVGWVGYHEQELPQLINWLHCHCLQPSTLGLWLGTAHYHLKETSHSPVDSRTHSHSELNSTHYRSRANTPAHADERISTGEWQTPQNLVQ